ncbi:MAG: DUF4339 domain-containing protein [Verrucomicrobia bacterium]|nr:DUF4339 domain-containing protein [Verrucomicrobiota bacterium]
MSQERYFLYVDGVQKGPYTVGHIGHMVNSGIVHSSAMFWCEGLEQWQPVTQLIVPKHEEKRRRLNVSAWILAVVLGGLLLFWLAFPTLQEGWREQHQIEQSPLAAYWSARGMVRSHVGWFTGLRFREFNPECVTITADGHASVVLEAEVSRGSSAERLGRWEVGLRFDKRLQAWMPELTGAPGLNAPSNAPPAPAAEPSTANPRGEIPLPPGN